VRSYLRVKGATIGGAHGYGDEELYWQSGYPLIR
jgi:hypothetical protein